MISSLLSDKVEIQEMRGLISRLAAESNVVDFEEQIQLESVQSTARIWRQDGSLVGFAYLDDYSNLWFDTDPGFGGSGELEHQMIIWGEACQKKRTSLTGEQAVLDSTCRTEDIHRIQLLETHGFQRQQVRTLHYSRLLSDPIVSWQLPEGFAIRASRGLDEIAALVELHRAAFETENMTVEIRQAMMKSPLYVPELDLVAVAPDGTLAAFCVCGFEDAEKRIGFTDPIGTHRGYRRHGLGQALVSTGLVLLKGAGAEAVTLGTSSDNTAMQQLAEKSGFRVAREQLWFSKDLA